MARTIIEITAQIVKSNRREDGALMIEEIAINPQVGFPGLSQEEVDIMVKDGLLFDNPIPISAWEEKPKREPIAIQATVVRPGDRTD